MREENDGCLLVSSVFVLIMFMLVLIVFGRACDSSAKKVKAAKTTMEGKE